MTTTSYFCFADHTISIIIIGLSSYNLKTVIDLNIAVFQRTFFTQTSISQGLYAYEFKRGDRDLRTCFPVPVLLRTPKLPPLTHARCFSGSSTSRSLFLGLVLTISCPQSLCPPPDWAHQASVWFTSPGPLLGILIRLWTSLIHLTELSKLA